MKKKLLVVGNGMVTGRFLDELIAYDSMDYEVTVLSAEPYGSYNRIMLSSVLSGEATIDGIIQKAPEWYKKQGMRLLQGEAVLHINGAKKQVFTSKKNMLEYDHLVLATGSRSAKIPTENQDIDNIFPFRSIADTEDMLAKAASSKNAVVVGGGFLGLEAAWGLAKRGVEVTVIHRGSHLLNRQLDETAGKMLQAKLETLGLKFCLGTEVAAFIGETEVEGAYLKNETYLECDMAIVATGISPNAEIAWSAGIEGTRAIEVDEYMRTSDPNISAIGECVEFEGATFGLVDPLWQHAQVLASRLCETDPGRWQSFVNKPTATKLKISGIQLYSAGIVDALEGMRELIVHDERANIYRKIILEDGQVVGIVLFGDVRSGSWYFELMERKETVVDKLPKLVFGQEYFAA